MQTTMTASEFEKNLEQLLQMVRNGTDLTLKVVATKKRGWSEEVLNHLRNPNPNWHLEPDFLPPKELDDYYNPFAEDEK